jgi:hypothetical protein
LLRNNLDRRFHSTETALNYILADWKKEIDEDKLVIAVFLDFKRAFETIDPKKLLEKMASYGIRGNELNWFKSFLGNRYQRTNFMNAWSELLANELGVPQGSII